MKTARGRTSGGEGSRKGLDNGMEVNGSLRGGGLAKEKGVEEGE